MAGQASTHHAASPPPCPVRQALRSCADEGRASASAAGARERGLRARLLSLQQQLEEQDAELARLQVGAQRSPKG